MVDETGSQQENKVDPEVVLRQWRTTILNVFFAIVAVISLPAIGTIIASAVSNPEIWPIAIAFLAVELLLIALAVLRGLPITLRVFGLCLVGYCAAILNLMNTGLNGAGPIYLLVMPILVLILVGRRASWVTVIISAILVTGVAVLVGLGLLVPDLALRNPWASLATIIMFLTVVMTILILFYGLQERLIKDERRAQAELLQAQALLEEHNATLEQKIQERTGELQASNLSLEQRTGELAQANKRMAQELALAGSIQAGFMASELPQMAGWQRAASLIPARQTSGDFYDIYPLGEDRFGILVADVVDKGVGAALCMAFCWALVHTYATRHPDRPDLVMQKVNRRLFSDTHSGQFVTLFYGVLDVRKNVMAYCNAGHNPPYLFSTDSTPSVQTLRRTGLPLGILPETEWKRRRAHFQPGDLLVLYTDGVTEAENACHGFYGSERLIDVVRTNLGKSAQEIQESVIRGLCEFAGTLSLCDDITLMVLSCERTSA